VTRRFEEEGSHGSNSSMCGQCGRDRLAVPTKAEQQEHPERAMFEPCWNCFTSDAQGNKTFLSPSGCRECICGGLGPGGSIARRNQTCPRCGSYVSRWGLLFNGQRLPRPVFDRYPAAWRIAFWATHGTPDRGDLGYVRAHLRDLATT